MKKWNGTTWVEQSAGAALALNDLSDVDVASSDPDSALVKDEDGVWRPRFLDLTQPEPLAVEIVGYDSYEGTGPYQMNITGVQADDIALLSRITGQAANWGSNGTVTVIPGFTNLGSANFGGNFGLAYKYCQNGETFTVSGTGGNGTSCAIIVVRNASLASYTVAADRWSFAPAAPQANAPAGSLDVVMSARRMNTPPAGWLPRNVDVPGGLIATKSYVGETALSGVIVSGGYYEYNGGGRALFTLIP